MLQEEKTTYIGKDGVIYNSEDTGILRDNEKPKENWESDFEKQFGIGYGHKWIFTEDEATELKQFIFDLLKSQRKEAIEETKKEINKWLNPHVKEAYEIGKIEARKEIKEWCEKNKYDAQYYGGGADDVQPDLCIDYNDFLSYLNK